MTKNNSILYETVTGLENRGRARMAKGTLTVVSGFSGVGKGSVMNSLIERYEGYALSVSATTRDPRPGEVHGAAYFFLSRDEFEEMIREDGLIEYARYCGNYYGTPKAFVEQCLDRGLDVLLEIEIQGAMKIRKLYPDATLVFVMPPSAEELIERLTGRGTESREVIESRVRRAALEAEGVEDYDFILVNDRIDPCADELHRLIQARKMRTSCNLTFIEKVRGDIRKMAEEMQS